MRVNNWNWKWNQKKIDIPVFIEELAKYIKKKIN